MYGSNHLKTQVLPTSQHHRCKMMSPFFQKESAPHCGPSDQSWTHPCRFYFDCKWFKTASHWTHLSGNFMFLTLWQSNLVFWQHHQSESWVLGWIFRVVRASFSHPQILFCLFVCLFGPPSPQHILYQWRRIFLCIRYGVSVIAKLHLTSHRRRMHKTPRGSCSHIESKHIRKMRKKYHDSSDFLQCDLLYEVKALPPKLQPGPGHSPSGFDPVPLETMFCSTTEPIAGIFLTKVSKSDSETHSWRSSRSHSTFDLDWV